MPIFLSDWVQRKRFSMFSSVVYQLIYVQLSFFCQARISLFTVLEIMLYLYIFWDVIALTAPVLQYSLYLFVSILAI